MKLKSFVDRMTREPVLGFGAVGLSITAWAPALVDNDAKKAAVAGILLYLQRILSVSKKTSEEQVETAKYVGAVEHQAVTNAAKVIGLEQQAPVAPPPPEPAAAQPQ